MNEFLRKLGINNSEILKRPYFIMGGGTSGRIFADLCLESGINIDGILVSKEYISASDYRSIPIIAISEMDSHIEGTVFYTVKQKREVVLKNNCECLIDISSNYIYGAMLCLFYDNYWKKHEITIKQENDNLVIKMKENCILIPSKENREEYETVLQEIGDLVLPAIFNDYSRVDEGPYEYKTVRVEEGDIVFDCGANYGIFSVIAAWQGAERIYAFEPLTTARVFIESQAKKCLGRINVQPYALSNISEKSKIYLSTAMSRATMLFNEDMKKAIDIETITIDEFVRNNNIKKLDFIKADIEGMERNLLMGATQTLANLQPKIAICVYHLKDDPQVLKNIILQANPNYIIEYKWKKLFAHCPYKYKGEMKNGN